MAPNATLVKLTKLGALKEYIYEVPNITQTVTQEQIFALDQPYGTFSGMKLATLNVGNTITVNSFIYEKSGVSTPTVYGIYERAADPGGNFAVFDTARPFVNNDTVQANQIYGKFRSTVNSQTGTITVAMYIKE
jgi:hypothetical protein